MTGFICEVDIDYRSACEGLPFHAEHEGTRYCVLHYPSEEKNREDFLKVKESKLKKKDYDFSGTVFPEGTSDFEGANFDASAHFAGATFIGEALFSSAKFRGRSTDFSDAKFRGRSTDFSGTEFGKGWANFRRAKFRSAETFFLESTFIRGGDFSAAIFKEHASFWGSNANPVFSSDAWALFDSCRIEKPEQLTFNSVLLHPGWFINTDVRKVDFTDVKWYGMPGGPEGTIEEEIDNVRPIAESPHTLLSQACRRLSANAEVNREYPLANEFHYWSMDALRKEGWTRLGLIGTLYWALSGYGVRAARALWVFVAICAAFAVLYMLLGPDALRVSSASTFGQALEHSGQAVVYSLSTMARLSPEPKPDPGLFQFLVTIEGILGPLQIALLALAIRRKVMR